MCGRSVGRSQKEKPRLPAGLSSLMQPIRLTVLIRHLSLTVGILPLAARILLLLARLLTATLLLLAGLLTRVLVLLARIILIGH
jgi:hypothetical protein